MSQELTVLGISAAITAGIQLSGFAVAYALQTETFYDILGGINFLTIGIYSAIDGTSGEIPFFSDVRKSTCTFLFCLSRFWLLAFLAWRAHERSGDGRFDEIKTNFSSFLKAWIFQGVWVFCISLPVIFVNGSDNIAKEDAGSMKIWEYVMIVCFGLCLLIEVTGDIQKAVWVKRGRVGSFCTVGVWKLSRHPNYFGEIFQWWFVFIFAFGSSTGFNDIQWWTSIWSPIMTMLILLVVPATGVYNANGKNLKRYYDKVPVEYAEYRKKTSILIPVPCGLYQYVPLALKRTIFFDFEMYEYKPEQADGENVIMSDNNNGNNEDETKK